MLSLDLSYHHIHFSRPSEFSFPPPGPIEGRSSSHTLLRREYITTPTGRLEVLSAHPAKPSKKSRHRRRHRRRHSHDEDENDEDDDEEEEDTPPAVFFVHGGMGSAWVWSEYMNYLASRGVPSYAVSLRGHGNSWHPSYLRLTLLTTRHMLASDVAAAVRWAQARENGADVVVVGHSSGGGLAQHVLANRMVSDVRGLVLLDAVPGFGSAGVYWNWIKSDPLCFLRMLLHLGHPNSVLSTARLVKQAFFSDHMPLSTVAQFQTHMSRYESFWWPSSMLRPFVDPAAVVRGIRGWGSRGEQRVMVMFGTEDRLMTVGVMKKLAAFYRAAVASCVARGDMHDEKQGVVEELEGEGDRDTAGQGVRYCLIPGAGHHAQNDVQWEVGARKLLEFYRQL